MLGLWALAILSLIAGLAAAESAPLLQLLLVVLLVVLVGILPFGWLERVAKGKEGPCDKEP